MVFKFCETTTSNSTTQVFGKKQVVPALGETVSIWVELKFPPPVCSIEIMFNLVTSREQTTICGQSFNVLSMCFHLGIITSLVPSLLNNPVLFCLSLSIHFFPLFFSRSLYFSSCTLSPLFLSVFRRTGGLID